MSVRTPGVCIRVCFCKGRMVTLWLWRGEEVSVLFLNVSLRRDAGSILCVQVNAKQGCVKESNCVNACVCAKITQKVPVVDLVSGFSLKILLI